MDIILQTIASSIRGSELPPDVSEAEEEAPQVVTGAEVERNFLAPASLVVAKGCIYHQNR
ncbi:MAG TPA: hypothetical protein VNM45_06295 [Bacillus sp. (in: firmicutes)]|nr:hypothetical protein [Bacillus sp. (in: firmicutes)]